MKRFISINVHIAADYITGVVLLCAPWLLLQPQDAGVRLFCLISGTAVLLLSLATNYPGGLVRVISFKWHLMIDIICGALFLIAAIVFNDASRWFFLILGIIAILFGSCTVNRNRR